jgi:hypothetical protein
MVFLLVENARQKAREGAGRPENELLQFQNCPPADGITAAVNWRDHGMSRWQLSDETTSPALRSRYCDLPIASVDYPSQSRGNCSATRLLLADNSMASRSSRSRDVSA